MKTKSLPTVLLEGCDLRKRVLINAMQYDSYLNIFMNNINNYIHYTIEYIPDSYNLLTEMTRSLSQNISGFQYGNGSMSKLKT